MIGPKECAELRRCIETFRPFTSMPIGAPGSQARAEQDEKIRCFERAVEIISSAGQRHEEAISNDR